MRFEFGDELVGGIEFSGDIFQNGFALRGVGFFLGEVEIRLDVRDGARELFFGRDVGFCVLALLKDRLRFLLVLPERRVVDFRFERFQEFAAGGNVKDNSARVRCAS